MRPMLLGLLLPAALAADPVASPDIVSETVVQPTPSALAAVLTNLPLYATALPSDCVGRLELGTPDNGLGAKARIRYDMAAMHRNLDMTVSRNDVSEGRAVVDFDHASNRGFVTRWFMERKDDGTHVKVTTAINAPPWPFTKYYFDAVKPEWDGCQATIVQNVARLAGSGP